VAQNQDTLKKILEHIDGLILSGGPDIHPKYYGEQPLPGLGEIDDELDQMELLITKFALPKNLPILAICRGIQVLNVSQGGSLYQDIANQLKGSINHLQRADKGVNTHLVSIEPGTRLFHILKRKKIWVNGKHHQAIKGLAPSLIVSAKAEDGVIEAVENPSLKFVIGVQWHPEGTWKSDIFSRRLFQAFLRSCLD